MSRRHVVWIPQDHETESKPKLYPSPSEHPSMDEAKLPTDSSNVCWWTLWSQSASLCKSFQCLISEYFSLFVLVIKRSSKWGSNLRALRSSEEVVLMRLMKYHCSLTIISSLNSVKRQISYILHFSVFKPSQWFFLYFLCSFEDPLLKSNLTYSNI